VNSKGLIFQEAAKVFSQKGYAAATVDEIAQNAGIAKGTIYYHFKGKRELFEFLIEDGIDALLASIQEMLATTEDPVEQIRGVIGVQLDFFQKSQDFCVLLFSEILGPASKWKEYLTKFREKYLALLTGPIERGQRLGKIRKVEPTIIIQCLLGAVSNIALDSLLVGRSCTREETILSLEDVIFQGILT
jgi:AcrR family transcriptional regulator